jgi:hypothetical protein
MSFDSAHVRVEDEVPVLRTWQLQATLANR